MPYAIYIGDANSGKTMALRSLQQSAGGIYISGIAPVTSWYGSEAKVQLKDEGDDSTKWRAFKEYLLAKKGKVKTLAEQTPVFVEFLVNTGSTLYIDDIDRISGVKAEYVKQFLLSVPNASVACRDLNLAPVAIRDILLNKPHEVVELKNPNNPASFDATNILFALIVVSSAILELLSGGRGFQTTLLLTGLYMLMRDKRIKRT